MKISKTDLKVLSQFLKKYSKLNPKASFYYELSYLKIIIKLLIKNKNFITYNNFYHKVNLDDSFSKDVEDVDQVLTKYQKNLEVNYLSFITNPDLLFKELYFLPSFSDAFVINCVTTNNDAYLTFCLSLKNAFNNNYIYKLNPNYHYSHSKNTFISLKFTNVELITGVLHNDYIAHMIGGHNKIKKLNIISEDGINYLKLFDLGDFGLSFTFESIIFIPYLQTKIK